MELYVNPAALTTIELPAPVEEVLPVPVQEYEDQAYYSDESVGEYVDIKA